MSTWRLPELPTEITDDEAAIFMTGGVSYVELKVPGVGVVTMPAEALIRVEPPLPPEPTELGWYLAIIGDNETIARKVEPEGWSVGKDGGSLSTWKTLNEDFPGITLQRLVPAPPVVELPWYGAHNGLTGIVVEPTANGEVQVLAPTAHEYLFSPPMAREMARALWTAADEAEGRTE